MKQLVLIKVFALLLAIGVTLSGCSTAPVKAPAHASKHTTGVAATVHPADVVAAKTTEVHPAVAATEALQKSEPEAPQLQAAKPMTPDQYDDLFDRIRVGYKISDADDESIDEQLNWYVSHPQYLERTFARGERYLYHIVTELEARNMPLELAMLPVVESAFEPFGFSRARASGLWQFIPPTGKRFGLKQNFWYDGRRDVVDSTRAALDYLQFLHDKFGDWLLAVAAYNCGEMNVERAIRRNRAEGKPTDFWHLKLPRETRAYVPKLMAMSRLLKDPEAQGIELVMIPNEPFFGKVPTGGQIDLQMVADLAGVTSEEVTYLNAGYNRWATDPDGPHEILLPVDACELFTENLEQIPEDERLRVTRYEVRKGETLTGIAKKHGTTAATLKELNSLSSIKLHSGQELMLPGMGQLHPKVALAAQRYDRPTSSRITKNSGSRRYHVVRSGDTLWSIAQRYGMKVQTLASLNGLKTNSVLSVGRRLVLKRG